jgi:hypothetical protein
MKDPRFYLGLVVALSAILGLGFFVSCAGDDDDDDSDDTSYGADIAGLYQVNVVTTFNSCPDGELAVDSWFLEIEQAKDLATANVYWQEEGVGSEKTLLFKGEVYGTAVVSFGVEKTKIGASDCLQLQTIDYYLSVDPEYATVTGHLFNEIFYLGAACSPSTVDCRTERRIDPSDAATDDDAADDDTAGDDDTSPES